MVKSHLEQVQLIVTTETPTQGKLYSLSQYCQLYAHVCVCSVFVYFGLISEHAVYWVGGIYLYKLSL